MNARNLSNLVIRKMEDDHIRKAIKTALVSCDKDSLGVIYVATSIRRPEWMRAQILDIARHVGPGITSELDERMR